MKNRDHPDDIGVLVLSVLTEPMTAGAFGSIEHEIRRLPGVKQVLTNASADVVVVEYHADQLEASYVVATMLSAGYQVEPWFGW